MRNVNQIICKYIYDNWVLKSASQRSFALDHNIDETIVRKIKRTLQQENYEYNIPISTLQKICESRNLSLSEFFKEVGL